jgi:gliding motility-associated-like protein
VSITVNALPVVTTTATSNAICIGGSVTLTGGGANTYTWTSSTGTVANGVSFAPTTTTTYSLVGTSTAGCTSTNTAIETVTVNALPTLTANASNTSICLGNTLTLSGAGANTYTWTSASGTVANATAFTPTVSDTYTVAGTDLNNCQNTTTVSVIVNQVPTVTAAASQTLVCAGTTVTLNGSGATTYTWTSSASGSYTDGVSFTPTSTASYSVVGSSTAGCTSTNVAAVSITVNALPSLSISATKTVLCLGDSTSFTASGAQTYTWTSSVVNGAYFKPTASASYTVNATDVNSCKNTSSVSLVVNSLPTLSLITSNSVSCSGQTTSLTASGASTYSWSNALSGSVIVVNPSVTTIYTVQGTDNNGCSAILTHTQEVAPCVATPSAIVSHTDVSCLGKSNGAISVDSVMISYPQYSVQYLWSPATLCPNNDCKHLKNLPGGVYPLSIVFTYTVVQGVVRIDTLVMDPVRVLDINDPCDLRVYTGITPNQDGNNDVWEITNITLYPKNRVSIFNRWGILVADIKGYDNVAKFWPSKVDLDRLPASTYFYIIDPGDGSKPIKGWIELMKD